LDVVIKEAGTPRRNLTATFTRDDNPVLWRFCSTAEPELPLGSPGVQSLAASGFLGSDRCIFGFRKSRGCTDCHSDALREPDRQPIGRHDEREKAVRSEEKAVYTAYERGRASQSRSR
jgi:hypothetical protein